MLRLSAVLALLAVVLAPSCAFADGAFAKSDRIRKELAEPDQKALLYLADGRETLILEVTYRGGADEFGWVVPVPARPELGTAPARLFAELALVTQPSAEGGGKTHGRGRGGAMGVSVLERRQVGPYDATVLAASDPKALATWLRAHHYVLPARAAEVLAPYVAQHWYYVALRIRVKRDLLARLRRVDPGLKSLQQAPEQVAGGILRISETAPRLCAEKVQAVDRAVRWATADPSDPAGTAVGGDLTRQYRLYRTRVADLTAARVSDREAWSMARCLPRCAGGPESEAFRSAARHVGWSANVSPPAIARGFIASVQRDLARDVPYARSQVGRFHAALRAAGQGPKEMFWYFQVDYETARRSLPKIRRLCGVPGEVDRVTRDLYPRTATAYPVMTVRRVMEAKLELYRQTKQQLEGARHAVDEALASGTIAPLRLDFASTRLVYPLRISSLNPGRTDVQLYVLSDHRMEAASFRTDFAWYIADLSEGVYPEIVRIMGPGRSYLTKLRATFTARQMDHDVTITRGVTDDNVHTSAAP